MSVVVHPPTMPGPRREPLNMPFYHVNSNGTIFEPGIISPSHRFNIPDPPLPPGDPLLSSHETDQISNELIDVFSDNPEGLGDLGNFPFSMWYPGHGAPMQSSVVGMAPLSMTQAPHSFGLTSPAAVHFETQNFATNQNTYYAAPAGSVPATPSMNSPTTPLYAPHHCLPHDPSLSPMQLQPSPSMCQAAGVLQSGTLRQQQNQSVHPHHVDERRFAEDTRRMSRSQDMPGNPPFGYEMNNGYQDVLPQQRDPPPALGFGTDTTFNNATYQPKNKNETSDFMAGRQEACVKGAMTFAHSAGSTRPSTPVGRPLELRTNVRPTSRTTNVCHAEPKRRHSSNEEPQSTTQIDTSRKRKANRASTGSPSVDGNHTRKKRRPSGASSKKDNLTPQQKRNNHIASEKKRRKVIEIGFKNLNALVPALQDQPASKAGTLHAAYDFVQQATRGNAELREIISQLMLG